MMKRQLLMVLIAVAFGLLTEIAVAPAAAATCSGSGCNGLNPITTGCTTGAYVVGETDIYDTFSSDYIGSVQLWWSPTCETAWSYVHSYLDYRAFAVQATITSTSPSNSYYQNNNYVYTARSPMVYATDVSYTSACGRIEDVGVSGIACSP